MAKILGGSACLLARFEFRGCTHPACASADVADDVASLSATDVGVVDWLKPWFLLLFIMCAALEFTVHCSINGGGTNQKTKGQDVQTGLHWTMKWIEMATLNPTSQGASTCGKEHGALWQPTTPLASSNCVHAWGVLHRAQDDDCHHPLTSLKISISMGSMPSYFRG